MEPPYAGARLVWSDPAAPTVEFDAEHVNDEDDDWLRTQLMRRVAPVSVLARGLDRAYRSARQAQLAARQRAARTRAAQADAAGDQAAQLTALRAQVSALQADVADWEDLATAAEEEAAALRAQVPDLQQRVEQLTVALQAAQRPTAAYVQADPWATLPTLKPGDEDSARNLFLQLSDLSEGKIVFTDRAATSWKKIRYPYPGEMRDAPVTLTKVATTLYDGTQRTLPYLADWIRDEFDLKVSLQDDTIEKSRTMRYFEYESVTYDRTPHVKVRDNAPHQHVGRIHFALDRELDIRARTIRGLPRHLVPESKVTPELSRRRSFGLHTIVFAVDECQELFTHAEYGREADELCTAIIKRGPALGIILILATQRPDAQSLPKGISANVGIRFCLRVMDQPANDMVLGTSAYKAGIRATTFGPRDRGIGYLVGASDDPQIVRSAYLDGPATERIMVRRPRRPPRRRHPVRARARRGPGGPISDSVYGRVWDRARTATLTPVEVASPLADRPYSLRHAAVSTWLNAGVDATLVAEWAGHSVHVLLRVYAKCVSGRDSMARELVVRHLGFE